MIRLVSVVKANDKKHKYKATFEKENKKLVVRFGGYGYMDFIQYSKQDKNKAENAKKAYLARHSINENFNDPLTAGALSRWLLWHKPSLEASIEEFRKRFNLL